MGTREEVYNDLAKKTSGGLTKKDIIKKKKKYISLKKSNEMKKKNPFKKKKLTKRKISFELNKNETTEFYCKTFNENKIRNKEEDTEDGENKINNSIDFLKLNSLKN